MNFINFAYGLSLLFLPILGQAKQTIGCEMMVPYYLIQAQPKIYNTTIFNETNQTRYCIYQSVTPKSIENRFVTISSHRYNPLNPDPNITNIGCGRSVYCRKDITQCDWRTGDYQLLTYWAYYLPHAATRVIHDYGDTCVIDAIAQSQE
jgi:hypothetical protein